MTSRLQHLIVAYIPFSYSMNVKLDHTSIFVKGERFVAETEAAEAPVVFIPFAAKSVEYSRISCYSVPSAADDSGQTAKNRWKSGRA